MATWNSQPIKDSDQRRLTEIVGLIQRNQDEKIIMQLVEIAYREGYFTGKLDGLQSALEKIS